MALRTEAEYERSLRDGRRVFFRGRPVEDVTAHPVFRTAVAHAAVDYRMAADERWRDLAVVDGASRFYHVPRTPGDLLLRARLIEEGTRLGGTVVPLIHEIGSDALFALLHVAWDCDRRCGTGYLPRVRAFLDRARGEDLALAVAQTDPKGDRGRGPAEQPDPDAYLRVVGRRADGIVVRGAKLHTSVSVNANELIVLPTRRMRAADAAWAVAFATPVATPGLTLVASPYLSGGHDPAERPLSARHKMVETFTWFDDVFVPWERVFLCGEWEFAGPLAARFVQFHRFTAVAYKLPLIDLMAGVAALLAEYNGIAGAGHVREKLGRMAIYAGTVRTLLEAAAHKGRSEPPDVFFPDEGAVNLAKYAFAHTFHEVVRDVQDLAGGLLVTAPSREDMDDPALGPVLERLLAGAGVSGADRLRALYLASDLVASDLATYHQVLAVHAEGSLEAERLTAVRAYDFERAKALAREAAGIRP
jgi:4-hydroxybutyryl-CoA dehydratase/vinylacetyl-CoA-Delta-isomerase